MYGTARATGYGYSLWELQIYGTVDNTATTPTMLSGPTRPPATTGQFALAAPAANIQTFSVYLPSVTTVDGIAVVNGSRDLNKDGTIEPYEDRHRTAPGRCSPRGSRPARHPPPHCPPWYVPSPAPAGERAGTPRRPPCLALKV
jgi:hypothetical protein